MCDIRRELEKRKPRSKRIGKMENKSWRGKRGRVKEKYINSKRKMREEKEEEGKVQSSRSNTK